MAIKQPIATGRYYSQECITILIAGNSARQIDHRLIVGSANVCAHSPKIFCGSVGLVEVKLPGRHGNFLLSALANLAGLPLECVRVAELVSTGRGPRRNANIHLVVREVCMGDFSLGG